MLIFGVELLVVGLQAFWLTDLILKFVETDCKTEFLERLAKGPVKQAKHHDVEVLKTADVGKASLEIEGLAILQFSFLGHFEKGRLKEFSTLKFSNHV